MKEIEIPVTSQNLQNVNKYLENCFYINRKRDIALGVARLLSYIVFVAVSVFIVFGLGSMSETAMLDFPLVGDLWKSFCASTGILEAEWYFMVIGFVLLLYLPSLVVYGTAYLVLRLILHWTYRGKLGFEELSGTDCEKARALVANQKRAVSYTKFPGKFLVSDEIHYYLPLFAAIISAVFSVIVAAFTVENKFEAIVGGAILFAIIGCVVFAAAMGFWMPISYMCFRRRIDRTCALDIDKYWVDNDPEEAARREAQQKEYEKKYASSYSSSDSYISTMAKVYAREQKENEEYLKRLHEWATGDDDFKPGSGDGI